MPPWARASALERELNCPVTGLLPQVDLRGDHVREAADWGTMAHRWKASGEVRAQPGRPSHERLFREKLVRTGIRREDWWPGGRHEVAMAVDCVRMGRAAEFVGDKAAVDAWRESLGNEYAAGEADYVGDLFGVPLIDDLKTGRFPPEPSSPQLRLYALGLWILLDSPDRVIASVTHWPRYPVVSLPRRESHEYTARQLTAFWKELRLARRRKMMAIKLRLVDQQANAVPGAWCLYCDGKASCTKRQEE